jgi:hypothetical protein
LKLESLQAYFLFPFALDREAILEDHPHAWTEKTRWIDGLDAWMASEHGQSACLVQLGPWKRATYDRFESTSPGYADLLYFNSIVRHVFFDTSIGRRQDEQENQLRCYAIHIDPASRLWFEGTDARGGMGRAEVTDLRLYLSAQGTGILSIGITTKAISDEEALWILRRLRKLYPPNGDSVHEGRTPDWLALRLERNGMIETLCEEKFESPKMVGFYPPLANTIKRLLYFIDYDRQEYEPVLDENMLVYCLGELNSASLAGSGKNADLDFLDEFLFLRHLHSEAACYESRGGVTLIGFTGHSCSLLHIRSGTGEDKARWLSLCGSHAIVTREEFDSGKMFHGPFYLMVAVACFYRAVLMDFSERGALVARHLLQDQQVGKLSLNSIQMVNEFRTEFLNFSGYWHFDELSCKQADNDLFRRLCREYRVDDMKSVLANELRHMTEFVYNFYQLRTTEAVNRLAMLSLIFGGGAVLTGFFGMNFGREFTEVVFEGQHGGSWLHYLLVILVTGFVFGSLALGTFVVLRSWRDYLALLTPLSRKKTTTSSLKREG